MIPVKTMLVLHVERGQLKQVKTFVKTTHHSFAFLPIALSCTETRHCWGREGRLTDLSPFGERRQLAVRLEQAQLGAVRLALVGLLQQRAAGRCRQHARRRQSVKVRKHAHTRAIAHSLLMERMSERRERRRGDSGRLPECRGAANSRLRLTNTGAAPTREKHSSPLESRWRPPIMELATTKAMCPHGAVLSSHSRRHSGHRLRRASASKRLTSGHYVAGGRRSPTPETTPPPPPPPLSAPVPSASHYRAAISPKCLPEFN